MLPTCRTLLCELLALPLLIGADQVAQRRPDILGAALQAKRAQHADATCWRSSVEVEFGRCSVAARLRELAVRASRNCTVKTAQRRIRLRSAVKRWECR